MTDSNDSFLQLKLHDKTKHILNKDDFIIFFDETGHELLSDPEYPVFGFGGCGFFVQFKIFQK